MAKPEPVGGWGTTRRSVRVDDDPWLPAKERAAREHRTVSDVINVALREYAEGRYAARSRAKKVSR
jgi:hypothetical protein